MIPRLFRRRTGAVLSSLLLLAGGTALAVAPAASASNAPKVTIVGGPTVNVSDVLIGYRLNRQSKAIASVSCSYGDGATSTPLDTCWDRQIAEKKETTHVTLLRDLAPGSYTFTVTVVLTDGGRATATTSAFTVYGPTAITISAFPTGFTFMGRSLCRVEANLTGFPPNSSFSAAFAFTGLEDGQYSSVGAGATNAYGAATVVSDSLALNGDTGTATAFGHTSPSTTLRCSG